MRISWTSGIGAGLLIGLGLMLGGCGGSGSGDGGSVPNVAGDYVFAVGRFPVECTDGSRFASGGSSEVIRIRQNGAAIQAESLTSSIEELAWRLGLDILDSSASGRVRSDSSFSIQESAALRDRFDGAVYDVRVNVDGRFSDTGWGGWARYALGSSTIPVICNAEVQFSGSKVAADSDLRSEPALTGAVPFDVYDSPGVVFRMFGMQ
jgi:hypothetical protein